MGCFLGCFGGDKDKKRRSKQRHKVIPRDQKHVCRDPPKSTISTEQSITEEPSSENFVAEARDDGSRNLVAEAQDRSEEQLSLSARKRVTFDSKVTTYDPVSIYESTDSLPESKKAGENEEEEGCLAKSSQSNTSSEEGSAISSVGSYPPNHRYQNCRDSDDEAEEFGDDSDLDDECDLDDEDYSGDSDCEGGIQVWSESVVTASLGSKVDDKSFHLVNDEEEVDSPAMFGVPEKEMRKGETKGYVRDRSAYIHPVLNPVENLSQWKSVKSKAAEPLKLLPQKENFAAEVEGPRASFSLEPTFKQSSSSSFRPKLKDQETGVDASLSNWLVTPDTTKKAGSGMLEAVTSEKSISQGSNSVMSFEDRPILGALTVEELKQMSAYSSPRKSPSRSPDEMPIIGTVGTYWNPSTNSGSASSFKGIPNSTSKYREDKRVNWHSTPFETRLDRALKQGSAEASKA
ncbi:uncharacterized protein LOC107820516 [Nicotiana tabacum]|uniref:Protein JASON n=1 Tax=Nicotiana tabacum TaxID=4097 RepID=A0A1S4CM47_TOBAC|nr:PREDICTED: protein JASON-like [Nicotiana tabacum]